MSGFWTGAAGGIASGLGSFAGLFGSSGPSARDLTHESYEAALKYQPQTIRRNMHATVKAARDVGIHPLVAMGAGTSGSGHMTPVGSTHTGSAWSDGIARAGGAVGKFFQDRFDEKHQAEVDLLRSQKNNIDADTRSKQVPPVPLRNPRRSSRYRVETQALGALPNRVDYKAYEELPHDPLTGRRFINFGGKPIYVDTSIAPSETVEALGGDVAQNIYGFYYLPRQFGSSEIFDLY